MIAEQTGIVVCFKCGRYVKAKMIVEQIAGSQDRISVFPEHDQNDCKPLPLEKTVGCDG